MSELNIEQLSKSSTSRPDLEKVAVDLGLVNAGKYQNKPAVLEAIKRVYEAKEDAATVDAELTPADDPNSGDDPTTDSTNQPVQPVVTDDNDSDDDSDEDDAETQSEKPKTARKPVQNRNQGHATRFSDTGRPLF